MLEKRRRMRQYRFQHRPLQHHEEPEIQAPQEKVPVGPVPDARQAPDHRHVKDPAAPAHPVAAQRNVHIFPEEGAQRDVPAPPELADAAGNEGRVEILQEAEAQHAAQADGHVGIAGKIEIQLQEEQCRRQPAGKEGHLRRQGQGLQHLPAQVRQQHLFPEAQGEAEEALPQALLRHLPMRDGLRHVAVADDGAGDELGEQGHIQQQPQGVPLQGRLAPVHVHGIGDDLEGIEGDADGELGLGHAIGKARESAEIVHQKGRVLEIQQGGQADDDADDERQLPAPVRLGIDDDPGADMVYGGGKEHGQYPHRLPPGVEQQRRRQEQGVASRAVFHQIVEPHGEGEEQT